MRALLKMLAEALQLPATDKRVAPLKELMLRAFGPGHTVHVWVLSSDRWAWMRGQDELGFEVSLDVRCGPGRSATTALTAAVLSLAEQRATRFPESP